jgi:hypothetical protein
MRKGGSFAGNFANRNVTELGSKSFPESPTVFGGRETTVPEGTEVRLLPGGKHEVVEKPKE